MTAQKIIFSDKIQTLSVSDLKMYRRILSDNTKAVAKINKEIEYRSLQNAASLEHYYSNSAGGVSLEKYRKAKANGTLKVIKL